MFVDGYEFASFWYGYGSIHSLTRASAHFLKRA